MANTQNLKKFGKDKPAPSSEEAVSAGKKGGQASAIARAEAKSARDILLMIDNLPVVGKNKEILFMHGVPESEHTYKTLRLVMLNNAAIKENIGAQRLLAEIDGDINGTAPTVNITEPIKISFVDKSKQATGRQGDPKIVGEYTPPQNTE